MITKEEVKIWWKKNWKYVAIGVAGGIAGGYFVKNGIENRLALKEARLDETITNAKKALKDISSKVDVTVKQIYETEAKKVFQEKLNDIATNEEITKVARNCIKTETNDILRNAAKQAVSKDNVDEAIKDFIDNNSIFVKKKIVEAIRDQIDEDFSKELMENIEEVIENAI